MNWPLIYEIFYAIILILVCLRVIYETRDHTKTLAYLLLVIFLPIVGMVFYFSFGTNYRTNKLYSKKLYKDDRLAGKLKEKVLRYSKRTFDRNNPAVQSNKELARMLIVDSLSALTSGNDAELLLNGEQKFPAVLEAIERAQHHIHLEYYIIEDGEIAQAIEAALIKKIQAGIAVRIIYDDFGSHSIRRGWAKRLRAAGAQVFPFHKILFIALANRLNYRNHRKIIVIDGAVGFVGGINISDRYINNPREEKHYWRDTHLRMEGPGVYYLQYLFLCDWNFCAREELEPNPEFFPFQDLSPTGKKVIQIAASGPDSDSPTILFSLLQAINLATEEILITTPYFIPGESLLDALMIAAMGGVSIKLLVPDRSDSVFVNAAARSYYNDLLHSGVEIYLYKKGFIHAKTLVADNKLCVVGTANMDFRSYDLNFEVNAIVYDQTLSGQLRKVFYDDLQYAEKIDPITWQKRAWHKKLFERTARLLSPLL